jgi:hypothetical protein
MFFFEVFVTGMLDLDMPFMRTAECTPQQLPMKRPRTAAVGLAAYFQPWAYDSTRDESVHKYSGISSVFI